MTDLLSPRFLVVTGILSLAVGVFLFVPDTEPPPGNRAEAVQAGDVQWQPRIEVARGAAYRGPWRMNRSDWRFVDDPTVALSREDVASVVWTDHVEQDLFFRAYTADGSARGEAPVNVSQNPDTFSWLPRVAHASGRADTIYVLWQEIIFSGGTHGGEALFTRSTDGGRTFDAPINLSQSEAGDGKGRLTTKYWHNGSLDLATGPEGTIYVAWTEYEGRLWLRRSVDRGRHFSPAAHVAGSNTAPARGPTLAVDGSGTVHLAWAVGEDPGADIRYTRSTGAWDAFATPRPVGKSNGHSDAPSLAVDSSGTVHLAYGESPSGPLHAYHVRYARSPNGDSAFSRPVAVTPADPDAVASTHFPDLQVSASGILHLLWERFPSIEGRPRSLGYAQTPTGSLPFNHRIVVPGSDRPADGFNGSQQGLLMEKIAINERGNLAVVNSTFDRGNSSHVWLYRARTHDR